MKRNLTEKERQKKEREKLKRKEQIVKQYNELRSKCLIAFISIIASFFIVPFFVGYFEGQMTLIVFGNVMQLEALFLWIAFTIIIILILHFFQYKINKRLNRDKPEKRRSRSKTELN